MKKHRTITVITKTPTKRMLKMLSDKKKHLKGITKQWTETNCETARHLIPLKSKKKAKKLKIFVLRVSKTFMTDHPKSGKKTHFKQLILSKENERKLIRVTPPIESVELKTSVLNENLTQVLTMKQKIPMCKGISGKKKIHTIRGNYTYWKKVIDQVKEGNAILSLRQWTGKPFRSKQEEFRVITKADKPGIQKIELIAGGQAYKIHGQRWEFNERKLYKLAKNDGLSWKDFQAWFPTVFNGCIIHFTKFRYK